jgi:low molecular weight protein-tyrosine phosphatase
MRNVVTREGLLIRILFVCLGNICRSPTAEGVFRAMLAREGLDGSPVTIDVDSAGTAEWHIGKPPDGRAVQAAARRGIDISARRARQVGREDFFDFDYLLAMDRANLEALEEARPRRARGKVGMFLDYAPEIRIKDVPDPYYGGPQQFDYVLDLLEVGSRGLLSALRDAHPDLFAA